MTRYNCDWLLSTWRDGLNCTHCLYERLSLAVVTVSRVLFTLLVRYLFPGECLIGRDENSIGPFDVKWHFHRGVLSQMATLHHNVELAIDILCRHIRHVTLHRVEAVDEGQMWQLNAVDIAKVFPKSEDTITVMEMKKMLRWAPNKATLYYEPICFRAGRQTIEKILLFWWFQSVAII